MVGQPNFTAYGTAQGFGVNWSELVPGLPTLSVGYSQGSGDSTIYGTSQEADSNTHLFNVHSNYQAAGFRLSGFYDHNNLNATYPEFLAGDGEASQESTTHDFGFGAQHLLPMHGTFYANYNRASADNDFVSNQGESANSYGYTEDTENAGASFRPFTKLTLNVSQNYTSNLTGYLAQNLGNGGIEPPGLNLGTGSFSSTIGGGATYQFTRFLSTEAQATYYDQRYFGNDYSGEYLSGTVNYGKRILNLFTFSASVIDSSNGQGNNAVGFIGNCELLSPFWKLADVRASSATPRTCRHCSLPIPLPTTSTARTCTAVCREASLDRSLQWKPQRFDQRAGYRHPQRGLFHVAGLAAVYRQRSLQSSQRNFTAGSRGPGHAGADARPQRFHSLWRFQLRGRALGYTGEAAFDSGKFQPRHQQYHRRHRLAQQHGNLQRPDAVPSEKDRAAGRLYSLHAGDQRNRRARQHDVVFCRDDQMVRFLLIARGKSGLRQGLALAGVAVLLATSAAASKRAQPTLGPPPPPDLLLDGGRKLSFERSFSLEREVKPKRSFWTRVVDVIAGQPDFHYLVSPYSVVTDSRGRIIVTDVAAAGIHIFDFNQQKYKFISRRDTGKDPMLTPQCVAVDAQDNIYVTDSQAGKVFVFDANGKFRRTIGSLKGGEGYFKRPTGIAVDSAAQRIYVTDTLRNKIFMMDMQGSVLQVIGKTGTGDGEFNFPTELRLNGPDLVVVDAMNFRVQVLDRSGAFRYAIGKIGDGAGWMFRPKGIGFDSESHLYVVDGQWGMVQVFDREGRLLYYFGERGTGAGQFQLPTGLEIDHQDRIYVVDSFNRRVQVFHYYGVAQTADGRKQ